MQDSGIPVKVPTPFAASAAAPYTTTIPAASQIGINPGRASWPDGFVPLNFTPLAAGGVPPFGADFNGLLNNVTGALQWLEAGGVFPYDSSWATAVGGYPAGARVPSATFPGLYWRSIVDNNTGNPDAGAANWVLDGRIRLYAALGLYVDASAGTDDIQHGTSAGAGAFRTRQFAWNFLCARYDLNNQVVTINCNGAFTDQLLSLTAPLGYSGPASVVWNFASGATVAAGSGNAFSAFNGGVIGTIGGTTPTSVILSGASALSLIAAGPGAVLFGPNVEFGACTVADISSVYPSSQVQFNNAYRKSGNSPIHCDFRYGGAITYPNAGITVTLVGSPICATGFFNGIALGVLVTNSATAFSGATGAGSKRFNVDSNAVIFTNNAGGSPSTYPPGTVAGTQTNGGLIV